MFVVLTFNFIVREHSRQSTFRRRDTWCHFGTINTQTLYIYYTIFSLYRSEFDPQQQHPSTGTTSKVGSAGRPLIVFVLHLATFRLVLLDAHTQCHIGSGSLTSSSDITWRTFIMLSVLSDDGQGPRSSVGVHSAFKHIRKQHHPVGWGAYAES